MKRPNVVLIVMDTVRADHLSCYGYHRRTTPNIDKIAREGILFKNAFSAAPWTPPAHASIFTGKYPSHHRTLGKNVFFKRNQDSLPEILESHGYNTYGVTCCSLLGQGSGFDKCFQEYVDVSGNRQSYLNFSWDHIKSILKALYYGFDKGAGEATEIVKSFIKSNYSRKSKERPFFVFINYFECHTPYDPPRPFKTKFCRNLNESSIYLKELILREILGKTSEKLLKSDLDIKRLRWIASGEGGFAFAAKKISISESEWQVIKSWYNGEINYLDSTIGNLIEFLRINNILDNTIIIITADHGENFGDHGLAVHPLCLYDSILRVPLIIKVPASIPKCTKIRNAVSTIDIFPTILNLAKVENFGDAIDGYSLYPFEERKFHDYICAEYAGLHMKSMGEQSTEEIDLIDKGGKCIRSQSFKYILGFDEEKLYNIQKDPSEKKNVILKHRKKANALRKQLEKLVDISFFGPTEFPFKKGEENQKLLERLKALGYV